MKHQTLLTVAALNLIVDLSPAQHLAVLYELAKEHPREVFAAVDVVDKRGGVGA